MNGKALRILILALIIAMIVPSAYVISRDSRSDETFTATVIFSGSEARADALSMYLPHVRSVVEPYDNFALVEMTSSQMAYLESQGAVVYREENLHVLGIEGYVFDTRNPPPSLPGKLTTAYAPGERGCYLVQFRGPIKNLWLEGLRGAGLDTVSYYPYNTYLVRATPEQMAVIGTLDYVQWTGIFQPAYKIRPVLFDLAAGESREVKVVTRTPDGVDSVLSALGGGKVLLHYKGADFGLARTILTLDQIEDMAAIEDVSYIEPYYEKRNDNANMQWIQQTNISGNRSIWAGADRVMDTSDDLNGTGQIITYSDTGLDYDHNMFRESAGTIANGDIYNVTDPSRRKVIRYQPMAQWFVENGIDPDGNGIPETMENPNNDGRLEAYTDSWPYQAASGHGTMVSGTGEGNDDVIGGSANDGSAKGSKIYFQDIGSLWQNPQQSYQWDDSLRWIPDDYHWLFYDAYKNGSRIHSNSWGAQNQDYDLEAMMADKFMWEHPDFLILYSNGNGAPCTGPFHQYDVGSPATAKSIVSVGSSQTTPTQTSMAQYSSCGPTSDGRRKPTITVVGEGTSSISSGNPVDNSNTAYENGWQGTSYASPAASGLAAMVRQYFMNGYYPTGSPVAGNSLYPSAALVKAMLMASGEMMTGQYTDSKTESKYPNNSQGWGRPLLDNVLYLPGDTRKLIVVNDTKGLLTGQVAEYEVYVAANNAPLKVFLAWTDYPGTVGASKALVNDLNLQVIAPNSTSFWGNNYRTATIAQGSWTNRGYSIPGGAPDGTNTDEGVNISTGHGNWVTAGKWKIRVSASDVPVGPQQFALVITGNLDMGFGTLNIDKRIYNATDTVNIEVRDSNLNPGTDLVKASSNTETAPETVTMTQTPVGSGIWRGSIQTEFGLPGADGKLQVKENDTITITYTDNTFAPPYTLTQTAVADASGPKITNVQVKDVTNAVATVTWDTDEPSTSRVYWGETTALEKGYTEDKALKVDHSIILSGLDTGTKYYFDVESTDWFDHSTRDDNAGFHYDFMTSEMADILVVYGDSTFTKEDYYRSALNANGWSFNEWYVETQGEPTLSLLQGYKVVLWQVGSEQYPPFTDTTMPLIANYLDGGGRLYVGGHDIAWAFGDSSGDSGWYNPQRQAWLEGTLKAQFQYDPRTFGQVQGITGNQISNDFTGGVTYTPIRPGGAADEVYTLPAGGINQYVWKEPGYTGSPPDPDAASNYISVMWQSMSNNGTAGVGAWGGKPSKLVYFAFEFTQINSATTVDADRNKILNNVILWLLGRDHPVATLSAPNGGETFTGGSISISWTATTFGGTAVSTQQLYYSRDAGMSWIYMADVAPGILTHNWNLVAQGIPNGNKYMVKVVVNDDGDPSLSGYDTSDATFTINRAGGDTLGPVTVPGSVRAAPNYLDSSSTVWFNGTIDDSLMGNSTIVQAEWFLQCTEPSLAESDGGTDMNAADSSFSISVENVTWSGVVSTHLGWNTVYIHGKDAAGNWGKFQRYTFYVLGGGTPDLTPPSPFAVGISLEGTGLADLRLTWNKAPEDDGSPVNVAFYDIFYSESYSGTGAGYRNLTSVAAAGAATYNYVASGMGKGDPKDYYFVISARDSSCNIGKGEAQLGKHVKAVVQGPNMISVPFMPTDASPATVLKSIPFEMAWTYNATDSEHWKSFNSTKTSNSLTSIDHKMGLVVRVSATTDFVAVGKVPVATDLPLQEGWNLVPFPSLSQKTVNSLLSTLFYDRIEGFDASKPPTLSRLYTGFDTLNAGSSLWVRLTAPGTLSFSN